MIVALSCIGVAAPIATARPRHRPRATAPAPTVVDVGPAHLDVVDGWRVEAAAASASGSIIVRGPDGAIMVLTRMAAGNLAAWSRETRDAHLDALIDGFTAVDGATVDRKTVSTDGPSDVPVLELALTRGGRPVAIRVILFRTLTVVAAATSDRDSRAIRASLARAAAGLHPDR